MIGQRLGPYEITRLLGCGSMGEVYAAERRDGEFEKEVAIKLIRSRTEYGKLLERFSLEKQILASLGHPNIAGLIDAGTTEFGEPYFVLELVNGLPIDQYCRQNNLSVEQKVKLFAKVCEAIHYAHQKLVIHRDIKPSNIMVTIEGEPKILDFGIAKFIGRGGEETLEQGAKPMTPRYASPEQVSGLTLTTATDIYSLGVLFYEILAGHSPYSCPTMAGLAGCILEQAPKPPSKALLSSINAATDDDATLLTGDRTPKERFSTLLTQKLLAKRIKGDLDNIILMTLRKEPERRYESVLQLRDDLGRFLKGYPIAARSESKLYVAGKWMKRNRLATALLGLCVIVGVSFFHIERRNLQIEAQRNAEVADFLVTLFSSADPLEETGLSLRPQSYSIKGSLSFLRSLLVSHR